MSTKDKIICAILSIPLFLLVLSCFASPAATRTYCDANRELAVAEAIDTMRYTIPQSVTNYMASNGIPTHVTNTETIYSYHTNYTTFTTNYYETTNIIYYTTNNFDHFHTNYYTEVTNFYHTNEYYFIVNISNTCSIAVTNTVTTSSESGANVTNLGDSSDVVLKFYIPRGAKGDRGEMGPIGPAGSAPSLYGRYLLDDTVEYDYQIDKAETFSGYYNIDYITTNINRTFVFRMSKWANGSGQTFDYDPDIASFTCYYSGLVTNSNTQMWSSPDEINSPLVSMYGKISISSVAFQIGSDHYDITLITSGGQVSVVQHVMAYCYMDQASGNVVRAYSSIGTEGTITFGAYDSYSSVQKKDRYDVNVKMSDMCSYGRAAVTNWATDCASNIVEQFATNILFLAHTNMAAHSILNVYPGPEVNYTNIAGKTYRSWNYNRNNEYYATKGLVETVVNEIMPDLSVVTNYEYYGGTILKYLMTGIIKQYRGNAPTLNFYDIWFNGIVPMEDSGSIQQYHYNSRDNSPTYVRDVGKNDFTLIYSGKYFPMAFFELPDGTYTGSTTGTNIVGYSTFEYSYANKRLYWIASLTNSLSGKSVYTNYWDGVYIENVIDLGTTRYNSSSLTSQEFIRPIITRTYKADTDDGVYRTYNVMYKNIENFEMAPTE